MSLPKFLQRRLYLVLIAMNLEKQIKILVLNISCAKYVKE